MIFIVFVPLIRLISLWARRLNLLAADVLHSSLYLGFCISWWYLRSLTVSLPRTHCLVDFTLNFGNIFSQAVGLLACLFTARLLKFLNCHGNLIG